MSDYQPVIPVKVRTARKGHHCDGMLAAFERDPNPALVFSITEANGDE